MREGFAECQFARTVEDELARDKRGRICIREHGEGVEEGGCVRRSGGDRRLALGRFSFLPGRSVGRVLPLRPTLATLSPSTAVA